MKEWEPGINYEPIFDPLIPGQEIPVLFSYTRKQRMWWRRVYDDKCAFPVYSERRGWTRCSSNKKIEIHHLTPTAWILEQNPGMDPNDINFEEGYLGIALCRFHHDNVIHKDIGDAIRNYWADKEGIARAAADHRELARQGIIFWDNSWDQAMKEIAKEAIRKYMQKNPVDVYPRDPKWKKKPPKGEWLF